MNDQQFKLAEDRILQFAAANGFEAPSKAATQNSAAASSEPDLFPQSIDVLELVSRDLPRPAELVKGILHQGSKMVINGGSKSFKTWTLIDLAISVAAGAPWWGCETSKGRVLYINFEIQDVFFAERVTEILAEKEVALDKKQLKYLGLRGHSADMSEIIERLMERAEGQNYALIIVDPIYKALGRRDENKAGDIATLMNEIERLAVSSGAAVAFGHHFSKGNQAGKEAIDRASGSGVFARDPDTIISMTPHEEQGAFVIDLILRNFAPMESFVVRREHPLMVRNDILDPQALKDPTKRQEKYSDEDLLEPLREAGTLTSAEWRRAAEESTGIGGSTFFRRMRALVEAGRVKKEGGIFICAD